MTTSGPPPDAASGPGRGDSRKGELARRSTDAAVRFLAGGPEHDAAILRLLRENPMAGEVSIALEREPSFFHAGAIEGGFHQPVVGIDPEGEIAILGSRSIRDWWVAGSSVPVGYLAELRVAPAYRSRIGLLSRLFEVLHVLHEDRRCRWYVAGIVDDNRVARRILESGKKGIPPFRRVGRMVSLLMPMTKGRKAAPTPGIEVVTGDRVGFEEIVACLDRRASAYGLVPRWTAAQLSDPERARGLALSDFHVARRDGRVVGCLARWDQRAYKQWVVKAISRRMAWARPFVNLLAPILGTPRIPAPGTTIAGAYLSHVAVDGDDPQVLLALLEAVYRDSRERNGLRVLTLSLPDDHPALPEVRARFSHRDYATGIYTVSLGEGEDEIATLAGRRVFPEIAIF